MQNGITVYCFTDVDVWCFGWMASFFTLNYLQSFSLFLGYPEDAGSKLI